MNLNGKPQAAIKPLMDLADVAHLAEQEFIQNWAFACVATGNEKLTRDLVKFLQVEAAEKIVRGIPFKAPMISKPTGNMDERRVILIGSVYGSGALFRYPLDLLNQHGFICGSTGTGKTSLFSSVALQAMMHVPVWIMDYQKSDYRHLVQIVDGLLVLNPTTNFVFNPLEVPESVNPRQWLETFVMIFCKSNNLLDGSEGLLRKAGAELYQELGMFEGSENFPTLYDLRDRIASYKFPGFRRSQDFQDTLTNRLDSYLFTCPETYAYSKGIPVTELARNSVVFELKGLGEKHATFLMSTLLYGLFLNRIAVGERGNTLRNLVVIDEAKFAFPPGRNEKLGFLPLDNVLAQSREVGAGLLLGDQTADLNTSVHVQTRLKLSYRLGLDEDIRRMEKVMGLTRDQAKYVLRLGVGEAITSIPEVAEPFLVSVPKFPWRDS